MYPNIQWALQTAKSRCSQPLDTPTVIVFRLENPNEVWSAPYRGIKFTTADVENGSWQKEVKWYRNGMTTPDEGGHLADNNETKDYYYGPMSSNRCLCHPHWDPVPIVDGQQGYVNQLCIKQMCRFGNAFQEHCRCGHLHRSLAHYFYIRIEKIICFPNAEE